MTLAPHPVTLRQLQYVVAVAEAKSFRVAADNRRGSTRRCDRPCRGWR